MCLNLMTFSYIGRETCYIMGTTTVTGAIIIITGWIVLIEFDSYPESERSTIIRMIKGSPMYILIIALLPIGIVVNVLGGMLHSIVIMVIGPSLILLQGIIVSAFLWKRKRWKSVFLFAVIVPLGIFIYLPLLIH